MTNERTLRHPNGGALKIGTEVHVSQDSFCDADSAIYGTSAVVKSVLRASTAGNIHSFSSRLSVCHIIGSTVAESSLDRLSAVDCVLDRVLVQATPTTKLVLEDVVAENCELYGDWELKGNARICEGTWRRAPRFKRITGDNGVDFGLTEAVPGYAMLGCWKKPLTELLKAGPRLGRKHGWSEKQITTAKLFYEMLLDEPQEM